MPLCRSCIVANVNFGSRLSQKCWRITPGRRQSILPTCKQWGRATSTRPVCWHKQKTNTSSQSQEALHWESFGSKGGVKSEQTSVASEHLFSSYSPPSCQIPQGLCRSHGANQQQSPAISRNPHSSDASLYVLWCLQLAGMEAPLGRLSIK